ncbi:FAD-dependent monooxygenase [Kocuria marina]|uniref:FAD-dependent monooxygenase n=1 Tax=Kocuria marina TaxID=223184 RepID=UPI0037F67970
MQHRPARSGTHPAAAGERHGASIRFGTELLELTQDDAGATAVIRDRASGEAATVRATYVIGADGGRSFVGQQAGTGMEGETGLGYAVNVWFEADLTKYREHRPGTLFFSVQPGRDVWLDSGTFITVRAWDEWVLIVMYDPAVEQIDLGEDAMMERVRKNIGDDSVEIRVKNISQWRIHHMLAETYRKGRAALEDGPMLAFVHDHEFVHQPLAHPGAVVPRVWLKQDGRRVSTIDLVGRGRVHPADRDRRGAVARGRSRRRRGTGSADRRPRHRCGTGPRGSHRRTACRAAQHPGHPRKGCTRRAERPRPGRTSHGRSLIMALGLLVLRPALGLLLFG